MNTGQKIRKIRELKGYDQKYMASVLGMNQSNYSRIESNTIQINTEQLNKLAMALEVTPEYIESFDENLIFQNCAQVNYGHHASNTYNALSETERSTFEKLLAAKDEIIAILKERLMRHES